MRGVSSRWGGEGLAPVAWPPLLPAAAASSLLLPPSLCKLRATVCRALRRALHSPLQHSLMKQAAAARVARRGRPDAAGGVRHVVVRPLQCTSMDRQQHFYVPLLCDPLDC